MQNVHRLLTIGCVLIGLMVLVSTVSAFFSPSIQAALTMPTRQGAPANMVVATQQPAMKGTTSAFMPPATTVPSPTAMQTSTLARDTFQRNDQRFWGTASDGQTWNGNANNAANFTIAGQAGMIANGPGAFDSTLGPQSSNAEVVFSGSLSLFSNGNSNIGSILRWTDDNNWYKAYLDGAQLILLKKVACNLTRLQAVVFPAQNGRDYTVRFRVIGPMLAAKAWLTGQAEPTKWMVMANDMALSSGFGGLRVVIQNGVVARIHMFVETGAM